MNLIAQLEFELAYYDIAIRHISHYTTGTPQIWIENLYYSLFFAVNVALLENGYNITSNVKVTIFVKKIIVGKNMELEMQAPLKREFV